VQGLVRGPHAARSVLVEEEVITVGSGEQRIVELSIPASLPQAPPLISGEFTAESNVPPMSLGCHEVAIEAALYSWWHRSEVISVDAPIQPSDLNPFPAASLDDTQGGLNGCDSSGMIATVGMNKVVLEVDDNKDRLGRVNHDTSVMVHAVVCVNDKFVA